MDRLALDAWLFPCPCLAGAAHPCSAVPMQHETFGVPVSPSLAMLSLGKVSIRQCLFEIYDGTCTYIGSALAGQKPVTRGPVCYPLHGVQANIVVANRVCAVATDGPEVDVAACDGCIPYGAGDWNRVAIDVAHIDIVSARGAPFDLAIGRVDRAANVYSSSPARGIYHLCLCPQRCALRRANGTGRSCVIQIRDGQRSWPIVGDVYGHNASSSVGDRCHCCSDLSSLNRSRWLGIGFR